MDSTNSAETATATIGAIKAGLSVVTINEQDSLDDVASALKSSAAKGLLFSPTTLDSEGNKRANSLHTLIPELSGLYPGDEFSCDAFPELKHLIHTGHKTIRGMSKFKENMFYAKRRHTNRWIAGTTPDATALEAYKGGNLHKSFTNEQLVDQSGALWTSNFKRDDNLNPVFLTLPLSYPLGFATLLGAAANKSKVFVPSTYSLNSIAEAFKTQGADTLVCEQAMYES